MENEKETKKESTKKSTVKKVTEKKETESNKTYLGLELKFEILLVYLIPILGLILSFMNDKEVSKRAKFAYNQSGAVFIVSLVLSVFYVIPFIGLLFAVANLLLFIFVIITMVKAYQGEDYKIPLVSDLSNLIWNKKDNKEEK